MRWYFFECFFKPHINLEAHFLNLMDHCIYVWKIPQSLSIHPLSEHDSVWPPLQPRFLPTHLSARTNCFASVRWPTSPSHRTLKRSFWNLTNRSHPSWANHLSRLVPPEAFHDADANTAKNAKPARAKQIHRTNCVRGTRRSSALGKISLLPRK